MQARSLAAAVLAATLFPSAVLAQAGTPVVCGARAQIVEQLESRLGESVRSIGLGPQNHIVEVYASAETGTWTIAVTSATGRTCLMASGLYFEAFAPVAQGEQL